MGKRTFNDLVKIKIIYFFILKVKLKKKINKLIIKGTKTYKNVYSLLCNELMNSMWISYALEFIQKNHWLSVSHAIRV